MATWICVVFKWNVVIKYNICLSSLTAVVEIVMQRAMGQKFMSVALLLGTLLVRTLPKLTAFPQIRMLINVFVLFRVHPASASSKMPWRNYLLCASPAVEVGQYIIRHALHYYIFYKIQFHRYIKRSKSWLK